MKSFLLLRVILSIIFFALVLFGNWWMVAILGFCILATFAAWEIVLGAVIMDLLYTSSVGFFGFPAVWTTLALLTFFAFRYLRSKLF